MRPVRRRLETRAFSAPKFGVPVGYIQKPPALQGSPALLIPTVKGRGVGGCIQFYNLHLSSLPIRDTGNAVVPGVASEIL